MNERIDPLMAKLQPIIEHSLDVLTDPENLPTHAEALAAIYPEELSGVEASMAHALIRHDHERPIYQVWTKEFIAKFGGYLAERISALPQPVRIAEIGAGTGVFAHHLDDCLRQLVGAEAFELVATDARQGEKLWEEIKAVYSVEEIDAAETIRKYRPQIVIVSWLPPGQDWTPLFRDCPATQEYILIGEPDEDGVTQACGSDATWFTHPGFTKQEIEELKPWCIGRGDDPKLGLNRSAVVSFRREQ